MKFKKTSSFNIFLSLITMVFLLSVSAGTIAEAKLGIRSMGSGIRMSTPRTTRSVTAPRSVTVPKIRTTTNVGTTGIGSKPKTTGTTSIGASTNTGMITKAKTKAKINTVKQQKQSKLIKNEKTAKLATSLSKTKRPVRIMSIKKQKLKLKYQQEYLMPTTCKAVMSNRSVRVLQVEWPMKMVDTSKLGKKTYYGEVSGTTYKAELIVKVIQ